MTDNDSRNTVCGTEDIQEALGVILGAIWMSLRDFRESRDYSVFSQKSSSELSALGSFQLSTVDNFDIF